MSFQSDGKQTVTAPVEVDKRPKATEVVRENVTKRSISLPSLFTLITVYYWQLNYTPFKNNRGNPPQADTPLYAFHGSPHTIVLL